MKKQIFIVVVLMIIHVLILNNLRFTAWPEMFSYPYFINNGHLPYVDFVMPYPPILPLILSAIFGNFGYNLEVLGIFNLSLILINDLLTFLIVYKVTEKFAPSVYALISLLLIQPILEGNMLWFDSAVVTPVLLSIYFLLSKKPLNIFLSGVFIGIAILTKQTAGLVMIGTLFAIYLRDRNLKNLLVYACGPFVLFLILSFFLYANGSIVDFFKWVLIYPIKYWSSFPGYVQMYLNNTQKLTVLLLVASSFGLLKYKQYLYPCLVLLSIIMVYPRFSFFHFQLAIALISISIGILFHKSKASIIFTVPVILLVLLINFKQVQLFEWRKAPRFYSQEEFKLAAQIKSSLGSEKEVFLLGLPSNLYVFSDTVPPRPWADNFGWYYEIPGIQEKVITGLNNSRPTKVFWKKRAEGNWFDLGVYQPSGLTGWVKDNYEQKYEIVHDVWLWELKASRDKIAL